ncbi:MAG: hypothetical protein QOF51_931 [Chloroflexota bacterium]|nr:hypothetical protein [Chloroflexota bacterium]
MQPLGPAVCPRCSLPSPGGRTCQRCEGHPHAVRAIIASYPFEGVVRAGILGLKYRGRRRLARVLTPALIAALERRPLTADLVIPVPLSWARSRERGFNQSELLARPVAAALRLPLDTTSLLRARDTAQQTRLPARERRRNVVGAFEVANPSAVADRRVLLVDDVCTTGATLDACGAALADAGAAGVWALVLARDAPGRPTGSVITT